MTIGPVTQLILGCLVLAIIVSLLVFAGKKAGILDEGLAQKIIWGTGAVIVVIIVLALVALIMNALGVGGLIKLP